MHLQTVIRHIPAATDAAMVFPAYLPSQTDDTLVDGTLLQMLPMDTLNSKYSHMTVASLQVAIPDLNQGEAIFSILVAAGAAQLDALAHQHNVNVIALSRTDFATHEGNDSEGIAFLMRYNIPERSDGLTGPLPQARHLLEHAERLNKLDTPADRENQDHVALYRGLDRLENSARQMIQLLTATPTNFLAKGNEGPNDPYLAAARQAPELAAAVQAQALAMGHFDTALDIALLIDDPIVHLPLGRDDKAMPPALQRAMRETETLPTSGENIAAFIGRRPEFAERLLQVAMRNGNEAATTFVKDALLAEDDSIDTQRLVYDALMSAVESKNTEMVNALLRSDGTDEQGSHIKLARREDEEAVNTLAALLETAQRVGLSGDSPICTMLLAHVFTFGLYVFRDEELKDPTLNCTTGILQPYLPLPAYPTGETTTGLIKGRHIAGSIALTAVIAMTGLIVAFQSNRGVHPTVDLVLRTSIFLAAMTAFITLSIIAFKAGGFLGTTTNRKVSAFEQALFNTAQTLEHAPRRHLS